MLVVASGPKAAMAAQRAPCTRGAASSCGPRGAPWPRSQACRPSRSSGARRSRPRAAAASWSSGRTRRRPPRSSRSCAGGAAGSTRSRWTWARSSPTPRAVARASAAAAAALGAGRSACVFTSRRVQQDDGSGGLVIGAKVNEALCAVAARVVERATPAFVVARAASRRTTSPSSRWVRRADVLGQVVAGVPAWRLGRESRLPGASYVVFPGNVGDADDLANVVETVAGASGAGVRRGVDRARGRPAPRAGGGRPRPRR